MVITQAAAAAAMKASSRDPLVRYGPNGLPSEPLVAHTVCQAQFVTDGWRRRAEAKGHDDVMGRLSSHAGSKSAMTESGAPMRRIIHLLYLDRVVRWRWLRRRGTSREGGLLAGLWIRRSRACQNKSKAARASMQEAPPPLPLYKMRIYSVLVLLSPGLRALLSRRSTVSPHRCSAGAFLFFQIK